ncbi:hypothetical protein SE17_25165 [Kouleothrix aurantiaca]|uniref:Uncharacterized protein n=1 Tax=Kouleothrix aurantiaca TaxID=186479 RepID=A0A0P9F2K5_9CHLR|nr:hypothetical protein SE17_25165 [Kouleothrix aurantiaca]
MQITTGKYNVVLTTPNHEVSAVLAVLDGALAALEYMQTHFQENIDLIGPTGRFVSWRLLIG